MCAGFQETRRELEAERIARYIQQDGLATNSDGKRRQEVYNDDGQSEAHRKPNAEQSNLAEQIAHKIGGGTSQLSPCLYRK